MSAYYSPQNLTSNFAYSFAFKFLFYHINICNSSFWLCLPISLCIFANKNEKNVTLSNFVIDHTCR